MGDKADVKFVLYLECPTEVSEHGDLGSLDGRPDVHCARA